MKIEVDAVEFAQLMQQAALYEANVKYCDNLQSENNRLENTLRDSQQQLKIHREKIWKEASDKLKAYITTLEERLQRQATTIAEYQRKEAQSHDGHLGARYED